MPVGLIQSDWGGTPAEAWTSREALEAEAVAQAALGALGQAGRRRTPKTAHRTPHRPANLYNAMIAPLLPYAIRGAIWYQGESNVGRAQQYQTLFPTMIATGARRGASRTCRSASSRSHRSATADAGPGQLRRTLGSPTPDARRTSRTRAWPSRPTSATSRTSIRRTSRTSASGSALWALATVYGQKDLVYSGPIYKSMKVEGDKIRLTFDHVGGGLDRRATASRRAISRSPGPTRSSSRPRPRSTARRSSSQPDAVKEPVAVRFAWHDTASRTCEQGRPARLAVPHGPVEGPDRRQPLARCVDCRECVP